MNAVAAAALALPTLAFLPALHRVVAVTGPAVPSAPEPGAERAPEPAGRPAPSLVTHGVATAAVTVALAVALRAHPWWLPAYLYLGAVGLALAIIDVRVHRLPDALTLPSYPVLAALLGLAAAFDGGADRWVRSVTAGGVVWLLFLGLWALPGGGLGFGDVKLSGLLGAALGWLGWTRVPAGFGIGMVVAGLVALGLLLSGRAGRTSRIAYGPFLLAGTLVAVLLAHPT